MGQIEFEFQHDGSLGAAADTTPRCLMDGTVEGGPGGCQAKAEEDEKDGEPTEVIAVA